MNTPTQDQLTELRTATQRHAELDMLVEGTYGSLIDSKFRGCSVGCLAHDIDPDLSEGQLHKAVANYYGYPEWLVHLQDTLFENACKDIHTQLAQAMKPRDNWKSVMHVIHWRILNEITLPVAGSSEAVVRQVMDLHKAESEESAAWSAAESAARSAARSAAESAARSAWSAASAASAAWSAARSAAESAAESAWSAAESAAWSAARPAAWEKILRIVLEEVSK